jgi:glycosyltransferase 2 family protein
MKKKYLSRALRILFAVAGIGYIAFTLTWSDQVVVPVGEHELANGDTLKIEKAQAWQLVEGDLLNKEGSVTLADPNSQGTDATISVAVKDLGHAAEEFRAKPGIPTTFKTANIGLLLFGLLIVGPIYFIQSYRWWLLMRARGIVVTLFQSFRLTMVGTFFNYCMPGTTGGDVVKAYYAAKNSDRRADSIMSVIFDRIAGLLGLVILGGVAGLVMIIANAANWLDSSEEQVMAIYQVTGFIWLVMLAGACGACVFYSRKLRKLLGINWQRIQRLPGSKLLVKVDDAALAFAEHKKVFLAAVAISLPVHLALASATAVAGYALGIDTPLGILLTVVPVLFLAAAVPLTYQGLGVMEGLAMMLLLGSTATENEIVGMLLLIRAYQVFFGLLGSMFLLKGDIHMHPEQEIDSTESDAASVETSPNQEVAAESSAPAAGSSVTAISA